MITIIGILIALLLPAVQAAREAARQTQCRNNLKQLSLAFHLHEEAHGHYPTGGWTECWTGDPDQGVGILQPGGWEYNILPYIEQSVLHDMGAGLSVMDKAVQNGLRAQTPLATFDCPSRAPRRFAPATLAFK